jgi:hypothetical protein
VPRRSIFFSIRRYAASKSTASKGQSERLKVEAAGIAPAAQHHLFPVAKSTKRLGLETGRIPETLILDRVETAIWRVIHAFADCPRDTRPYPVSQR